MELPNADRALKPGMYATIRFKAPTRAVLSVPRSAVLATGERNIVFVDDTSGMFTPREVRLGASTDDRVEIISGIAAANGSWPRARSCSMPSRTWEQRWVAWGTCRAWTSRRPARDRRRGRHSDMPGMDQGHQEDSAMLARIIDWSLRNRLIVALFTTAAIIGGIFAVRATPLEALPDLSDVQVIVQAEFNEQAPRIVEDQVTYPIAAEMLKVPGARVVRGYSFFGISFVYVIFDDGTDLYWARSRVLEYLNGIKDKLPATVTPTLGPDATGLGWVFQYSLEDTTGTKTLAELRSIQDWYLRYALTSVPGVSEVASIGGFEKQYQIDLDPARLLAYRVPDHVGHGGHPERERRRGRDGAGTDRTRVHGARPWLPQEPR